MRRPARGASLVHSGSSCSAWPRKNSADAEALSRNSLMGPGMERRVAVFNPGDLLGDSVMRLPLLYGIRKRWPDHRVWWVTGAPSAMAGAMERYTRGQIDQFHTGFKIEQPLRAMARAARDLPSFDVAFCIHSKMTSVLAAKAILRPRAFYSCLPLQIGSSRRDPNWLFRRPVHMNARIRSMAAAARCELPAIRDILPISEAAHAAAERILARDRRNVGFIISTANRVLRKAWPLDRFIALANRRLARGDQPVFLIGPEEKGYMDQIRAGAPGAILAELYRPDPDTGAAGVDLCLAIGERLTAGVATDTGLAHVLAVVGTPLVSLFGPTDPARWHPEVEPLRIVRAQEFGSAEMAAIPLEPVAQALDSLLDL